MKELVFLLEESSAAEMLKGVVPRIFVTETPVKYIAFEGKQDLEKNLVRRLKGYCNPDAFFVIVRDQVAHPDCKAVKRRLARLCSQSKISRTLIRIACRELESFYLADLAAVERGLGIRGLAAKQRRAKCRDPDALQSPSRELDALTQGRYQKILGSRTIAPHLDLANERSRSFRNLIEGIRRVAQDDV